jgi:hypothetical protein
MKNSSGFNHLIRNLFFLVLLVLTLDSCYKNNEVVILDNRIISQLEYFRGTLNSSANFTYEDNKIVYRDFENDKRKHKYDYEYSENQVVSFISEKYDEYWVNTNSNVYSFESTLLQEVLYREYDQQQWDVYERWTFTYDGTNYDEILIEKVSSGNSYPVVKLTYSYASDTLIGYTVYQNNTEWVLTKEFRFEYKDGVLSQTTVFYSEPGQGLKPQELFSYQYTNGYNTKVVLSMYADSVWLPQSEILRTYNLSGKMIEETIKKVGETDYEYRYVYAYELGEDNLAIFPFYEKPLYEFIYPTLSSSLQKALLMEERNLYPE